MDLLFKRYANPYVLLDEMIAVGRFDEFIVEVMQMHNHDELWNLYLHHGIINVSFDEFKRMIHEPTEQNERPANLEATVSESVDILQGFVPEE